MADLRGRFWSKALILGPWECWPWTAYCHKNGYGRFGSTGWTHRVAYELTYGPIPEGMVVRHACDHPWCVSPGHLLLGSKADNSWDMVRRRRHRFGEGHHAARLTEVEAMDVRLRIRAGEAAKAVGLEYGISPKHAWAIGAEKNWRLTSV